MDIKKVAVLGSGVMGSGIAAHMANAGIPVVLLDIVPEGAGNRNALTEGALEKQLNAKPSGFVHKRAAKLVTCGNLEDDLELLKDVDWIVEAVLEKIEVKQSVYKKIDAVRKKGSVVSSNTSTLPLHTLTEGLSDEFKRDFMITHFFNPPRFMRLLEVLGGKQTRQDAVDSISRLGDIALGKSVVHAKDTPGFLANRIGIFWMIIGLLEAEKLGIRVEEADAVMSKPMGIPKTGIFGLYDLIGIDLMPLIAKAMLATLPADDLFRKIFKEPEFIREMINQGYTGRKGKGGFYRINKSGEKKVKEALNIAKGDYQPEVKAQLDSVNAAKDGLRALVIHPDIGGRYAFAVLSQTLYYAASLLPEISDDILSVDEAMRAGYNWKYGPFELIDRLGTKDEAGTAWLSAKFEEQKLSIPSILKAAAGRPLYRVEGARRQYMTLTGSYADIPKPEGVLLLGDKKLASKPIMKNGSASLWDMGDGVACLELTSKMNSVDPDILSMIEQAVEKVPQNFKGFVIGGDADNFSVGANLAFILLSANMAAWSMISDVIRQGQRAMMGLKYAPFPVVTALSGMALGGGCEINLHARAVQAHMESYPGLVEVGVGVIPGWGGCKEMILRHAGITDGEAKKPGSGFIGGIKNAASAMGMMPAISKAFETIMLARIGGSAEEARDMKVLNEQSRITMNRARLLADAKSLCLELAPNYKVPEPPVFSMPGATAKVALMMAVDGFKAQGKATAHDVVVAKVLAHVLSGGNTDLTDSVNEQHMLDLEHEGFMELIKTRGTLDRIQHMLETGKPLRN